MNAAVSAVVAVPFVGASVGGIGWVGLSRLGASCAFERLLADGCLQALGRLCVQKLLADGCLQALVHKLLAVGCFQAELRLLAAELDAFLEPFVDESVVVGSGELVSGVLQPAFGEPIIDFFIL